MSLCSRSFAVVSAALVSVLSACFVENNPSPPIAGSIASNGNTPLVQTSTSPILAVVDTGQVMTAPGGGGVGTFVEYQTGGHWHVYWTCDTNVNTTLPPPVTCSYDVVISSASSIANVATQGGIPQPATSGTSSIESIETVSTGVPGLTFDTAPGATITVDTSVSGLRSGQMFFFVQNGVVDGNVDPTQLTDPMMFRGSTP